MFSTFRFNRVSTGTGYEHLQFFPKSVLPFKHLYNLATCYYHARVRLIFFVTRVTNIHFLLKITSCWGILLSAPFETSFYNLTSSVIYYWTDARQNGIYSERFEPRNHFKSRVSLIVRVNVVLCRTVVVNSDWRFDNLCRGGSRIFFRRGCTRLLFYFNTNKPHSFFFAEYQLY